MARRIVASTGSNAYAQATTILIQLLSLPLFLSQWDVATYGHWIVLSAVPAYLAMADVGMVSAAGNRMTMLTGDAKLQAANRVFQSALAFVLIACAVLLPLVVLIAWWWPASSSAAPSSWRDAAVIAVLSATVAVTLVGGLPEAIYKATQRYALGAALGNTTRLLEWLGSLIGLWWGGDFLSVAIGALVARAICTAAMAVHAARTTPAFRWGFGAASLAEIRHCAGPAISFMAFPAANAINFQGMTLIAASLLGPAAAVMFNAYRTMARVTVQATGTFGTALWPEFSRLFGKGDFVALASLYRRSCIVGISLAAIASAVVYGVAPAALALWSKGQITFLPNLMSVSMVCAAAAGCWHVPRVLLLSTNAHTRLAWPLLAASAACLPLAWALGRSWGLIGIVTAMLVLEVGMLVYCVHLSRRLLSVGVAPKPWSVAT